MDPGGARALGVPLEALDARGAWVVPGLVDPHEHFLGAGGEQGFATRRPELSAAELLLAGITTAVGCLGTDSTTRHLGALVGKARELQAHGVSAWLYTGGFHLPPRTLTGSVRDDLVLIPEFVGVGELAIADVRGSQAGAAELARVVADAYVGGTLSGKAGVTHFHAGPGRQRLSVLRALLDEHELEPASLYVTHLNRTDALLDEGLALARRGCFVDVDTVEPGLGRWLRAWRERGGPPGRLSVSSDAQTAGAIPGRLLAELAACVREEGLALEEALPCFTATPAAALKLGDRGRIAAGLRADVVVLERETLRVRHVVSGGEVRVRDGQLIDGRAG